MTLWRLALAVNGFSILVALCADVGERRAPKPCAVCEAAVAFLQSADRDGGLVVDFWTTDVFALYADVGVPLVPCPCGRRQVLMLENPMVPRPGQ